STAPCRYPLSLHDALPILEGAADLVLGARARTVAMPVGRRCTNWLSAALASRIGGTRVPDAQTGFRALSRRAALRRCAPGPPARSEEYTSELQSRGHLVCR